MPPVDDYNSRREVDLLAQRLTQTERNVSDQAKTLSALIDELKSIRASLDMLRIDREVRVERDKHLNERFDRLERAMREGFAKVEADVSGRFANLNRPLWAAATALISTLVAGITTWITGGGISK